MPLAGLITMIGTLSVAVSLVSTFLAGLINNSNWLLARILILFVGYLAHKPGASINVADLRTLSSPPPSFVVAPLLDSACLLVRTPEQTWLVNTGRETATPAAVWHLLQFYGVNRLDGVVLAQMSAPDNSGAEMIVRDFRPQHLAVPVLRTRSPLEKSLPDMIARAGGKTEPWQRGQSLNSLRASPWTSFIPLPMVPPRHADDRALVLLFHAGDRTLLWAGRIGVPTQRESARRPSRIFMPMFSSWVPNRRRTTRGFSRSKSAIGSRFRPATSSPIPPTRQPFPISARSGVSTKPARSTSTLKLDRTISFRKFICSPGWRCLIR